MQQESEPSSPNTHCITNNRAIIRKPSNGGAMSSQILGSKSHVSISVQKLMTAQFAEAKRWWFWENVLKMLVAVSTIASFFWKESLEWTWLFPVIFTGSYTFIQWHIESVQGKAEAIKRKLEYQDGLGWKISEQEKADLYVEASRKVKKVALEPEESPYFDSPEPISSRRAVENLMQSAWYTRHQASGIAKTAFALSIVILLLAIVSLAVVVQSPPLQQWGPVVGQTVLTVLVVLLAMGYFRLSSRYRSLSRRSEKVVDRASDLKELENISDIQVLRLLHEYQIARAAAPMIPEWLWKRKKHELNRLWKQQSI